MMSIIQRVHAARRMKIQCTVYYSMYNHGDVQRHHIKHHKSAKLPWNLFVLYKMTNKSIFVEPHWKLLSMGVQCSKLVQTITFAELWQCSGQCLDAGHSRWPKPLLAMSSAQLDGPRWPLNSPQIQAKPFYVYLAKLAIYMACEQGPFPTCEKEDV